MLVTIVKCTIINMANNEQDSTLLRLKEQAISIECFLGKSLLQLSNQQ
ncbi:hypothetical protein ACVW2L_003311 [Mucilaginibacter sp. HD30]